VHDWASLECKYDAEISWPTADFVSAAGDIKKAKDAGFHTCQGLMMNTKKVHKPRRSSCLLCVVVAGASCELSACFLAVQALSQIRGLSEAKVEKLLEAAKKMCPTLGWQSAMEVERQVRSPRSLSPAPWRPDAPAAADVLPCHRPYQTHQTATLASVPAVITIIVFLAARRLDEPMTMC